MASISHSAFYSKAAINLPKDAKVKLFKMYHLLLSDPRHPSLHFKKIKGAKRNDIYECRVDRFWRVVIQWGGGESYKLVTVGEHDKAIEYGAKISEPQVHYFQTYHTENIRDNIEGYLEGNDAALAFKEYTLNDLEIDELLMELSD
jgi:hypothetical protein